MKKILRESLFIVFLSLVFGLGFQADLFKRFIKGDFARGFIDSRKYPQVTFISMPEAEELFFQRKAIFIDSRPQQSFDRGHIPGAVNMPHSRMEPGFLLRDAVHSLEEAVVVYCEGGECQESISLARILHDRGLKNIKIFSGGWAQWSQSRLPVEKDDALQ